MRRLFMLWRVGGRDLRLLFQVMSQPHRPRWLLPALLAVGFFAFEPLNFAFPLIGVVDDFVLLPMLLRLMATLAAPSIRGRDPRVVSVQ